LNDSSDQEESSETDTKVIPSVPIKKQVPKKQITNTAAVLVNEDKKYKKYNR